MHVLGAWGGGGGGGGGDIRDSRYIAVQTRSKLYR